MGVSRTDPIFEHPEQQLRFLVVNEDVVVVVTLRLSMATFIAATSTMTCSFQNEISYALDTTDKQLDRPVG